MTQKEMLQRVRALGLCASVRGGEIRVAPFFGNGRAHRERAEAIAYYTEDRDDAVMTAGDMARRLASHRRN